MSFTLNDLFERIDRNSTEELRSVPLSELLSQDYSSPDDSDTFSRLPILYYYLRQGLASGNITGDRLLNRAVIVSTKLMDCPIIAMAIKHMETPDIYIGLNNGDPESVHVLAAIYMKTLRDSTTGLAGIEPTLANLLVVLLACRNANINSMAIPECADTVHDWLFKTWRVNSILPSLQHLSGDLNSKLLGKSGTCLLETLLDRPKFLLEHRDQFDEIVELAFASGSEQIIRLLVNEYDQSTIFLLSVLYLSSSSAIAVIHRGYRPNYMEVTQLIKYIEFCCLLGANKAVTQLLLILQCVLYKGIRLDTHQFNILTSSQKIVLDYCRKYYTISPIHPLIELAEILGFYYYIDPAHTNSNKSEPVDLPMIGNHLSREQILTKIRDISRSEPNRFKAAILTRRFISLNSLNIIPDSGIDQSWQTRTILEQDPYCLFDADMVTYMDGSGVQWSFISEQFEGILSSKTNPYTDEAISENILSQIERQRATLKRLGLGIDTPTIGSSQLVALEDSVLDNSTSDMITKYISDLIYLAGINMVELNQLTPDKCYHFFKSSLNRYVTLPTWTNTTNITILVCYMIWYCLKTNKMSLVQTVKLFEIPAQ